MCVTAVNTHVKTVICSSVSLRLPFVCVFVYMYLCVIYNIIVYMCVWVTAVNTHVTTSVHVTDTYTTGELTLERDIYKELIEIFRSPETIIALTKAKEKED